MTSELTVAPAISPMYLIQQEAAKSTPDVALLKELFDLKLRVEADEARKAFNESMARFKANPPKINKNKDVTFGETSYSHATLDHVVDMIAPALSKVGIRHRWENKQDQALISVTCILSHESGHSELTTLAALADASGKKNSIQAIASTVTYLQRYTLLGATGLAAMNTDDDGRGKDDKPHMDEDDYQHYIEQIAAAHSHAELKNLYTAAYTAADNAKDDEAKRAIIKAKNARRIVLG